MVCNEHLNQDIKKNINGFNKALENSLVDTKVLVYDDELFQKIYLEGIYNNYNSGVLHKSELTPDEYKYGDVLTNAHHESGDKQAIDKELNTELTLDIGTNNERFGRADKS